MSKPNQKPRNRKLTKTQALERFNSLNNSHCESDSQSDRLTSRKKRLTKKTSTPAATPATKKSATPAANTDNNSNVTDQLNGKSWFVYLKK